MLLQNSTEEEILIRLGIIKADEVDEALQPKFGDTIGMFQRMFSSAGVEHLSIRSYDARNYSYPNHLDECDGYLISGSRYCAFSKTPWIQQLIEFVRTLDRARKKLIGICFGHQCIALALGGSVVKSKKGWGLGVQEYEVLTPGVFAEDIGNSLRLRCSHEDQVSRLPERAMRLLSNDFCENAGMVVASHIVSFQAHPEFDRDFAEHLILNREQELGLDFEPTLASLESEVDSIPVARSLIRYLEN